MQIAVVIKGKFQSATGTTVEGDLGLNIDIAKTYVETETISNR